MTESTKHGSLARYAWLSVGAAIAIIALKTLAWLMTGSVGMLSDALESVVNLVAAFLALWMLRIAAAPPDGDHPFGRSKVEYFASGFEGALIVLAAVRFLSLTGARRMGRQICAPDRGKD